MPETSAKTLDGHGFLDVVSRAEFEALLAAFPPLPLEDVDLDQALGRVLGADILAPEDLPRTARASMDGYALACRDAFGATEGNPAYLDCVADLPIDWDASGQAALQLQSGQCARIPTGGSLPTGADSVAMVEHTGELGAGTIEIRKSVAPGENVMLAGEDMAQGAVALPAGRTLRPQDVGLLAALGIVRLRCGARPRVGLLSTGDELVPASATPRPGQIRDVNTHALACLVQEAGALPKSYGIIPDNRMALTGALALALAESDVLLISGGSSLGARDHTLDAIGSLPGAAVLAHGVAISPGKPTILARVSGQRQVRAVLGLPGQVTSAQVVLSVLVRPLLKHLAGDALAFAAERLDCRTAELARNIAGKPGREDFVRVRLETRSGLPPLAHPVLGKSGLLKTLLTADGLVAVPANAEGLYQGALVEVRPL